MREFTPEELEQIKGDMNDVSQLWSRFKHEYRTSATATFHPPPVLIEVGRSLAAEILGMDETNTDFQVLRGIVNISAALFEFGQFCQENGYRVSNMTQCACCRVDDTALERLLGDA